MVWKDVLRVDGVLAWYLGLEESMIVERNELYLRDLLWKRVGLDADLIDFPAAVRWPSPLWSSCLSALQLESPEGSYSSSRGAQSWQLQQGFLEQQVKEAHRRDCAACRQRTKERKQARQQEKERVTQTKEREQARQQEKERVTQDEERVVRAEKERKEDSEKLERERERAAAEKLEAERRVQQAEIKAAARAKAETQKLERRLARVQADRERLRDQLKKADPPSRDHLRRKSTQQQQPVQRAAITVHDVMETGLFSHDALKELASPIHGKGLGTKVAFVEGDTILTVLLPDVEVPAGYDRKGGGYTCMGHIMHTDGLGALVIDPSKTMRGTIPACRAFMEIGLLRLLNHSLTPNAKLQIGGGGERMKPWWYERAGGVEYGWWYECSIVARADIAVGAEVTIEYANPPEEAVRPQPPKRASKRSRRRY
ncbi:unnamed protein product [Pylaiella littoralis]